VGLFISNEENFSLTNVLENKLNEAFLLICNEESIPYCSINLKITNDDVMRQLNNKFRKKNNTTNVLSFVNEDISKKLTDNLGDIAISYEFIKKEAQELNINFDDHMIHMLIHGVYHILGFNHDNDKRACVMEKKEIKLLNKLNIKSPY